MSVYESVTVHINHLNSYVDLITEGNQAASRELKKRIQGLYHIQARAHFVEKILPLYLKLLSNNDVQQYHTSEQCARAIAVVDSQLRHLRQLSNQYSHQLAFQASDTEILRSAEQLIARPAIIVGYSIHETEDSIQSMSNITLIAKAGLYAVRYGNIGSHIHFTLQDVQQWCAESQHIKAQYSTFSLNKIDQYIRQLRQHQTRIAAEEARRAHEEVAQQQQAQQTLPESERNQTQSGKWHRFCLWLKALIQYMKQMCIHLCNLIREQCLSVQVSITSKYS